MLEDTAERRTTHPGPMARLSRREMANADEGHPFRRIRAAGPGYVEEAIRSGGPSTATNGTSGPNGPATLMSIEQSARDAWARELWETYARQAPTTAK